MKEPKIITASRIICLITYLILAVLAILGIFVELPKPLVSIVFGVDLIIFSVSFTCISRYVARTLE